MATVLAAPPARQRLRYEDGQLDDIASVLWATHPRAGDYLEQAPALALVVAQTFGCHVTYGERDRFAATIAAGPKLRDVMAGYGLAAPMRKIGARGIRPRHVEAVRALSPLDASSLSQSIPTDSQGVWLDAINQWLNVPGPRPLPHIGWLARGLCEDLSRYEQVGTLIDWLTRSRDAALNERWSWAQAMDRVEQWHRGLRDERAWRAALRSAALARTFDDVICKSGLPDHAEVDGLTFTPLRTIRRLREEGAEMHHCIASYASMVKGGDCAIVAVKRDGVGVATLQLDRAGRIAQLRGHCNAAPAPATRKACEMYALLHWRTPEAADAAGGAA